jgi:hypothetical protein
MKGQETATELAAAHWGYIDKVLTTHAVPKREIEAIGFHYRTAMIHGFKHGVEWEQDRAEKEAFLAQVVDDAVRKFSMSAPLCPSCRRLDTECHGDNREYPATKAGGCEGYIEAKKESLCESCADKKCAYQFERNKRLMLECSEYTPEPKAERKASLCHSCDVGNCTKTATISCEMTGHCNFYTPALRERMMEAKEEAAKPVDCKDCVSVSCIGAGIGISSVMHNGCEQFKPAPVALAICPSCDQHPGCKGTVDPAEDGSCKGFSPKDAEQQVVTAASCKICFTWCANSGRDGAPFGGCVHFQPKKEAVSDTL